MKKIVNLLVLFSFMILPVLTFAQDDPSVPPPPFCPTSKDPIMGGAALQDCIPVLVILAVLYGAYKMKQIMKERKAVEKESLINA